MTDKQIIAHGVDVSGCDNLNTNAPYGWDDENMCSPTVCKNSPNCSFKQLARKTQECEELKEQNRTLIILNQDLQNKFKTSEQICRYKDEVIDRKQKETNRYKQAIEKIEAICNDNMKDTEGCGGISCESCSPYDEWRCTDMKILDIINEVKNV